MTVRASEERVLTVFKAPGLPPPSPPPRGRGGLALVWPQMRFPKGLGSRPQSRSLQGAEKSGEGPGNVGLRPGRGWAGPGGSLGVPVGAHSSHRGAMEAPAELLAALPALATVLALLLAWLLVRRAQAASSDPAGASPEPVPRAEASGTSALHSPGAAPEPAAAPEEPGEPAGPAEAEEQAAEAKQEERPSPSSTAPGSCGGTSTRG
ncbi:matrix-remodeling-associated protein 7 isoform X6 [Phyllostomus discolor]|uniref:Matrix-remodeling-associated protein 7 isoform X6 n=1 Tax=Phyllostomus discolor TaxID=89673 RepID=A0A7E6EER5_9CHIR|nr:matrix-remodeling-associated protein 7 isoform X6 [Phyllostomus discolor]